MRGREDLLGGDVGVAGHAVLGRRGAAVPLVSVGQADRQVGAGAGIMEGAEALSVQPLGLGAERRIMRRPGRHGILAVDAGGREDGLRQPAHRLLGRDVGEDLPGPGGARIGDDVPVDVEAGDPLHGGAIGDRIRPVGARHFRGVLAGQQHRILAHDGEPRRVGVEGLGHAVVEPARRAVETGVAAGPEPRQRHLGIGEERRHQAGARPIGVVGDAPHQRQRLDRRGEQEILPGLELQSDLHRHFGQGVEPGRVDGSRRFAEGRGHERLPVCRSEGSAAARGDAAPGFAGESKARAPSVARRT